MSASFKGISKVKFYANTKCFFLSTSSYGSLLDEPELGKTNLIWLAQIMFSPKGEENSKIGYNS